MRIICKVAFLHRGTGGDPIDIGDFDLSDNGDIDGDILGIKHLDTRIPLIHPRYINRNRGAVLILVCKNRQRLSLKSKLGKINIDFNRRGRVVRNPIR